MIATTLNPRRYATYQQYTTVEKLLECLKQFNNNEIIRTNINGDLSIHTKRNEYIGYVDIDTAKFAREAHEWRIVK